MSERLCNCSDFTAGMCPRRMGTEYIGFIFRLHGNIFAVCRPVDGAIYSWYAVSQQGDVLISNVRP